MKVQINNDHRIFIVVDSWGKSSVCNLEDLNKVVKSIDDDVKIYHLWNGKQTKATKKQLKEMLEIADLKIEF